MIVSPNGVGPAPNQLKSVENTIFFKKMLMSITGKLRVKYVKNYGFFRGFFEFLRVFYGYVFFYGFLRPQNLVLGLGLYNLQKSILLFIKPEVNCCFLGPPHSSPSPATHDILITVRFQQSWAKFSWNQEAFVAFEVPNNTLHVCILPHVIKF